MVAQLKSSSLSKKGTGGSLRARPRFTRANSQKLAKAVQSLATNTDKLLLGETGSDSYCNEGYIGPLCSSCLVENDVVYYLSTASSGVPECVLCENPETLISILTSPKAVILIVLVVLALSVAVLGDVKPDNSKPANKYFRELTRRYSQENDTSRVQGDGSLLFQKREEPTTVVTRTREVAITSTPIASTAVVTVTSTEGTVKRSKTILLQQGGLVQAFLYQMKVMKVKAKALVAFFQIMGKVSFNYSFDWPDTFDNILDELNIVNLDFLPSLGLNCYTNRFDYIHQMVVMTISPLILSAMLFLGYLWVVRRERRLDEKTSADAADDSDLPDDLKNTSTPKELSNLREVFMIYDSDGSGVVDHEELTEIIKSYSPNMTDSEVELQARQFSGRHTNEEGITFREFVVALNKSHRRRASATFAKLAEKVEASTTKIAGQSIFYAFLTLTFLVLIGTSTKLFSYFKCRTFSEAQGGTEKYLFKDYTVDCNSSRYKAYVVFAVLMVLVYPVGIPVMYAALLYTHRQVVSDKEAMDREAASGYPSTGHLLFLIEAYKPEFFYFDVMECGRRLVLAAVIGMVAADSAASPTISVCISLFFVYQFTAYRPYKSNSANNLCIILAFSLTLFFLAALMIKAGLSSDNNSDQDTFSVILSILLFSGPIFILAGLRSALFAGLCFLCISSGLRQHKSEKIAPDSASPLREIKSGADPEESKANDVPLQEIKSVGSCEESKANDMPLQEIKSVGSCEESKANDVPLKEIKSAGSCEESKANDVPLLETESCRDGEKMTESPTHDQGRREVAGDEDDPDHKPRKAGTVRLPSLRM